MHFFPFCPSLILLGPSHHNVYYRFSVKPNGWSFLAHGIDSKGTFTVILKSQELQIDWDIAFFHSLSHWNNYPKQKYGVNNTQHHLWEMLRWNAKSKERFLSLQCFITFLFTVISFLNAWLDFCPLDSKVWIVVEQLLYLLSFGLHLKGTPWLSKLCGIMGSDLGFIWTCLLADAVEKLNGTEYLLSGRGKMCCDLKRDCSEVLRLEGAWETWQLLWALIPYYFYSASDCYWHVAMMVLN